MQQIHRSKVHDMYLVSVVDCDPKPSHKGKR